MRFLILFTFFISNVFANEIPPIKNLVLIKELKKYDNITFLDSNKKKIKLDDFNGKLILLNFWAVWCAPCKEEMPSLDILKSNSNLNNLEIFPINVGKDNIKKSNKFFEDLNIKNLDIYYDNSPTLAKTFSLRGIPTTIIFNKEGFEFARILGSIDFNDKKFIDWLKQFN
tara:strand:+ start:326 stop:835 length:510 start_codon:yes stop_codon:yes gene_type:complete